MPQAQLWAGTRWDSSLHWGEPLSVPGSGSWEGPSAGPGRGCAGSWSRSTAQSPWGCARCGESTSGECGVPVGQGVSTASGCWEQQAGPGSEQGSRGLGSGCRMQAGLLDGQRGCASAPGSQNTPGCLHLWIEEICWEDVGDVKAAPCPGQVVWLSESVCTVYVSLYVCVFVRVSVLSLGCTLTFRADPADRKATGTCRVLGRRPWLLCHSRSGSSSRVGAIPRAAAAAEPLPGAWGL